MLSIRMEISGFTVTTGSLWMYRHDYTLIITLKKSLWNVGSYDLCYNFDPASVIEILALSIIRDWMSSQVIPFWLSFKKKLLMKPRVRVFV